jgi:hypothetical protein
MEQVLKAWTLISGVLKAEEIIEPLTANLTRRY